MVSLGGHVRHFFLGSRATTCVNCALETLWLIYILWRDGRLKLDRALSYNENWNKNISLPYLNHTEWWRWWILTLFWSLNSWTSVCWHLTADSVLPLWISRAYTSTTSPYTSTHLPVQWLPVRDTYLYYTIPVWHTNHLVITGTVHTYLYDTYLCKPIFMKQRCLRMTS